MSFVLPPLHVAITRHQPPFAGANDETYVGLPPIARIAVFTWQERRNHSTWLIVLPLLTAALFSLGAYLIVRGHLTSIPLPWDLIGVQLTTVGIRGRYLVRVHAEVLRRPLYLLDWVKRPEPETDPVATFPLGV